MSNPQGAASRKSSGDVRRRLTDGGRVWAVYEHLTLTGIASLIFDCGEGFRRIRPFPAHWTLLSDVALRELCHAPVNRIALEGAPRQEPGDIAGSG